MRKSLSDVSLEDLIVFRSEDFIIINKPPGILSQADASGQLSMIELVNAQLNISGHLYNRLDQPVSGLLVIGIRGITKMDIWTKKYLALTKQQETQAGTLDHYIARDGQRRRALVSENPQKGYKSCQLTYQVLHNYDHVDLVEITLTTGRFHQIRAQMAYIGRPIRGDVKYGARRGNQDRSIDLHAYYLRIPELGIAPLIAPVMRQQPVWQDINDRYIMSSR